jgi:transcriptional regulator with XRE-family HTH domain
MGTKRIPNSLKLYRRRRGLKQTDVARILGIRNASMISRWEKGLAIPKYENIRTLALIYRTSSDALYADYGMTLKENVQQKEEALKISH